eukprot:TRINITY_DN976_c0_g1_i1.p1 TRINITY_DN976_c0_g1~~TRINITY_DN976_c0_g1_i1.p1  ORF type:complete len:514 (-),score=123.03 TRINITY_DN976_c0_g1_i1:86-1627(-)
MGDFDTSLYDENVDLSDVWDFFDFNDNQTLEDLDLKPLISSEPIPISSPTTTDSSAPSTPDQIPFQSQPQQFFPTYLNAPQIPPQMPPQIPLQSLPPGVPNSLYLPISPLPPTLPRSVNVIKTEPLSNPRSRVSGTKRSRANQDLENTTDQSSAEMKRLKRMRRNRESAQKSRQKKKEYVDTLEQKVELLQNENLMLKQQVATLSSLLQVQGAQVPGLNPQTPSITPSSISGKNPTPKLQKTSSAKKARTMNNNGTSAVKVGGVCLMIVLFSFGLFFNPNSMGPNGVPLPFKTSAREQIPTVVPGSSSGGPAHGNVLLRAIGEYRLDSEERELLDYFPVEEKQKEKSWMEQMSMSVKSKFVETSKTNNNNNDLEIKKQKKPGFKKISIDEYVDDHLEKNGGERENLTISSHGLVSVQEIANVATEKGFNNDTQHMVNLLDDPDRTYYVCSDVREVVREGRERLSGKKDVSLLIPVTNSDGVQAGCVDSMVEVSCKVAEYSVYRTDTKVHVDDA